MGTISRLSFNPRGLNRFTAVLIAFFMSSILLATSIGGTVFAAGENYSWEDKETVVASGGSYGETLYFSKGKGVIFPFSNPPQLLDLYVNNDPIVTSDGCFIKLGIQVNGSDNSRGTLRRIADPVSDALASNHCPESYSLSKDFATSLRLENSGQASANPSTVITVTIRSLVPEGEDFPGDGDTFTLKVSGQDKVLVSKKATEKNAYTKDGMTGYERTFKFKTTPDRKFYEACSQALNQCSEGDSTALSDLLGGAMGVFLFEIVKEDDGGVVCSAGALGWVLCPVMQIMAETTEWVAGQLEDYLAFNPFAGAGNQIKTLWTNILNVANVILVIAFLIVIFSQSTSIGLSSYGIKRMLPRIIAAAILMNLSFYICQILVDISNIAGVGVTTLVSAASGSTFSENVADVGAVRMAIAATAIVAVILFFFLIPVVLAFLAIFFTIAARNAIIVLLVIVAPLAFAAWVLPNTEKYFKKWWELFINMLILYPMVMLIFAASVVAANVIQSSSTPSDAEGSTELQSIIALIVLALPLFAMPLLFKTAGGALGRINAMTRDRLQKGADSKAGQFARNKAKSYGKYGAIRAGTMGAGALNRASRGKVFNPEKPGTATRAYRRARAFDKAIDQSLEYRKQGREAAVQESAFQLGAEATRTGRALQSVGGSRYTEIAAAQQDKAFAERKKAIAAQFDRRPPSASLDAELSQFGTEFKGAVKGGDTATAGAIVDYLTSARGAGGRQGLQKILTSTMADPDIKLEAGSEMHTALNNAINRDNYSTLVSKSGGIAKGGFRISDGKITGYDLNLGGVGTEQLATQDSKSLADNYSQISAKEAQLVLSNEELRSKISDSTARTILEHAARGEAYDGKVAASPPPAPPAPVRVVNESITNVQTPRSTINLTQTYGSNLSGFDATSLSSLIGNTAGSVSRLNDGDLETIAQRVNSSTSAEFNTLRQQVAAEQTARRTREAQKQDQDAAYDTYRNDINPPPSNP